MMSQIFMGSDGMYGEAGTRRGKSLLSISPQMPASKTISLSPPMINESPLFNDFQYVGETMGVENGTIFLPIEKHPEDGLVEGVTVPKELYATLYAPGPGMP